MAAKKPSTRKTDKADNKAETGGLSVADRLDALVTDMQSVSRPQGDWMQITAALRDEVKAAEARDNDDDSDDDSDDDDSEAR